MIDFNNYEHFKNYCFKIAQNKGVELTTKEREVFVNFEYVVNFLDKLKQQNKIHYNNGIVFNAIVDLFKTNNMDAAISNMGYLLRKISKCELGEVNLYYVFTSFHSMLGIKILFTEEFIYSAETGDMFYPSRLRVLEICEDTDIIYSISINGLDDNKIPGVYFIYDNKGVIAYIGKSTGNAISRSFASVIERKLVDFSKIEIRATKTISDIAIYEAYYISKFKPYCNNDMVFEDEATLLLPELAMVKSFGRDLTSDSFEYTYSYIKSIVYDIDNILPYLNKTMFLDNERNHKLLESRGYLEKYPMKQKAYEEMLNKVKASGKVSVTELKWIENT